MDQYCYSLSNMQLQKRANSTRRTALHWNEASHAAQSAYQQRVTIQSEKFQEDTPSSTLDHICVKLKSSCSSLIEYQAPSSPSIDVHSIRSIALHTTGFYNATTQPCPYSTCDNSQIYCSLHSTVNFVKKCLQSV